MSMNEYLAEAYGTAGYTEGYNEDLQKQAEVEMFAKLAAAEGIDLNELTDDQVAELWDATMGKEAQEEEEGEEEEEKKEKAKAELAQKKESADKVAEADYCGRVMAHAFAQELGYIEKDAADLKGLYTKGRAIARGLGERARAVARKFTGGRAAELEEAASKVKGTKVGPGMRARAKRVAEKESILRAAAKERKAVSRRRRLAGGGAALTAAGLGGGLALGREKGGSAIDELAVEEAIYKAAEVGWDAEEAAERIASIEVLGLLPDSEKIAHVDNTDDAISVRALEMLEAAGYPINWD